MKDSVCATRVSNNLESLLVTSFLLQTMESLLE
jgi:hypothetical protein